MKNPITKVYPGGFDYPTKHDKLYARTGEFRAPGVGDFFLSGNPARVYGGLTGTLSYPMHIMREVEVERPEQVIPAQYRFKV